jgi:hypothetical protein
MGGGLGVISHPVLPHSSKTSQQKLLLLLAIESDSQHLKPYCPLGGGSHPSMESNNPRKFK